MQPFKLLNPDETLSTNLQVDVAAHLISLEDRPKNYLPDIDCDEWAFVRYHFTPGLDIYVIAEDIKDELLELGHGSSASNILLKNILHSFGFTPAVSPSYLQNSTLSHYPSCLDLHL